MTNKVIRKDEIIHTGKIDYFDFSQQGTAGVVQEPFDIYSGDAFSTSCYYTNTDNSSKVFGLGSNEEMCIAYIMYYPRLNGTEIMSCGILYDEQCTTNYTTQNLTSKLDLPRTFGVVNKCTPQNTNNTNNSIDDKTTSNQEIIFISVKYNCKIILSTFLLLFVIM